MAEFSDARYLANKTKNQHCEGFKHRPVHLEEPLAKSDNSQK